MRSLKPLYLWGAGDGALWVLDLLEDLHARDAEKTFEIAGLIADDFPTQPILKKYPFIHRAQPDWKKKINCQLPAIITPGSPQIREMFFKEIKELDLKLPSFVHPTAVVSSHAILKEGCLIGPHCVISAGVILEENCLINFQCAIGHVSTIGRHSVLSSGTQIGGGVVCGEKVFTGMNAVLVPRIQIGRGAEISAGALVSKSLEPQTKVMASLPRQINFS